MKRMFLLAALTAFLLMPRTAAAQVAANVDETTGVGVNGGVKGNFGNLNQSVNGATNGPAGVSTGGTIGVGPDAIFTANSPPAPAGTTNNLGNYYCVPTATINALTFLENVNQAAYVNTPLTQRTKNGDGGILAAQTLAGGTAVSYNQTTYTVNGNAGTLPVSVGANYFMTDSGHFVTLPSGKVVLRGGTKYDTMANALPTYFANMAPGAPVSFGGASTFNLAGFGAVPNWFVSSTSNAALLSDLIGWLQSAAAVEINVYSATNGGHMLTLTGLNYNPGVPATLSLNAIDPANPSGTTTLTVNPTTLAITASASPTVPANSYNGYSLTLAFEENVPELDPGSTVSPLVLVTGALLLVARRRRVEFPASAVVA